MKKISIVQLKEACQKGSQIDRIIIAKEDQVLSNICMQYKSREIKKLTNKQDYAFLMSHVLEFTDQTFETLMVELRPFMDESELKFLRIARQIPIFKINHMRSIDAAYRANKLIYFSDFEDRHGSAAAVAILPKHPDYAEDRQKTFYLGTTYFDFVRNKEGKIVDGYLRLKNGCNASDAIEWIVNDREAIKYFDCSASIVLSEYLSILDFLREFYGIEHGTQTFNLLFGSQKEAVPESRRLLLSPLGSQVNVLCSQLREQTLNFSLDPDSKTSDNPADRPINPVAYFVGFKSSTKSDVNLRGECGNQPLCIGEHVAIINHPQYAAEHPFGASAGYNCIFVGKNAKGEDMFNTFGVGEKTESEINLLLLEAYNAKSKVQIELEQSKNKQYAEMGKMRPILLAQKLGVPDQITLEQLIGFSLHSSTEFYPEKLLELTGNIDCLLENLGSFVKTGDRYARLVAVEEGKSFSGPK